MTETGVRPASARDRHARYVGLLGAVALTVAAYTGGALPDATARLWHPVPTVLLWLLGTTAMVGAWWSLREDAPSTGWALRTAALWTVPLLFSAPLGSRDLYSYACQGWVYADGGDPYATGVAEAGCPWLDAVAPVWRDTAAPYGPFFVLLAALAVVLGGSLAGTLVVLRVLAVAGLLLAALCLPGLARAAGVPPARATWLVLACPLVGVHLVSGAHNDAVMLGLLLLGLLLLVRRPDRSAGTLPGAARWPVGVVLVAGVLLGLAVSVKATAVVVLPFAALAAVRGRYTVAALLRDGGLLAAGVLGALLVSSLLSGLGLGWIGGLGSSGDTVQWTSPPTAVGMLVDYLGAAVGLPPVGVPVARIVALILLAVLLVLLWWRTWSSLHGSRDASSPNSPGVGPPPGVAVSGTGPDVGLREPGTPSVAATGAAEPSVAATGAAATGMASVDVGADRIRVELLGAGLALALTVVLAPVFHPWYATWPLALLALAATRTTWFLVPVAAASFLALPDGTNVARLVKAPGAVAMTLLVIVLAVRFLPRQRRTRKSH
ncbi:polyprenol phosphomannose-dependent alpha 1,6 mannosyltransferase MptB [Micromonospora sp. NPDC049900]|uniref:polyprenol phosphomannose-dependent alpha 1,6 mannosyltransferase MptB n=1 Tax=Micromonospora sp. NPDC049900 TaxID=3364275 RepID=UPI00378EEB56